MQLTDIVLTEHIGQADINLMEKGRMSDAGIYNQDTAWLQESDMVVAECSVEWQHYATALEAVQQLRSEGYTICTIEQVHGSVSLERYNMERGRKYAIVLGNEVKGVSQQVVDASDCCIELPQRGTKHSLNIANTAAIVMWQFFEHLML